MTDAAHYAELHCHSYFSLLDGASAPEELVARAVALGLRLYPMRGLEHAGATLPRGGERDW